jgi:hypothetical protein
MEIWLPAKLYHALPLLCLLLGGLFLFGGSGAANFVLSVVLIGYGCWAILIRFCAFLEEDPRW